MTGTVRLCKMVYRERDGSHGVLWAPNMAGLAAAFRNLLVAVPIEAANREVARV